MKYADMINCYNYYVEHSREIVSRYSDAVVLKTDGWNETLKDNSCGIDHDIPVLTKIGAREEHCIEILPQRALMAQERNPSVKVICADLTKHDYGESRFDVILDLSTIDHIHPDDLIGVLNSYSKWLTLNGTLWLVVWLNYNKKWHAVERSHPNNQFHFEIGDFTSMLTSAGFVFPKPELLLGSKSLPGLMSFECRKR